MPGFTRRSIRVARAAFVPAIVLFAACSEEGSISGPGEETALLSVSPVGGSTAVDVGTTVTIAFDHAMNPAMSDFAALHEGDPAGPLVAGSWSWSEGNTTLTFTPDAPLTPGTTYAVHLGGGMRDASGGPVDFQRHGPGMGGAWATAGMMSGGGPSHMGAGWQHPSNGTFGMIFPFTTAG